MELEFHVCTMNKSAYTKKVWKRIEGTSYIYIYIYIYFLNIQLMNYSNKLEFKVYQIGSNKNDYINFHS